VGEAVSGKVHLMHGSPDIESGAFDARSSRYSLGRLSGRFYAESRKRNLEGDPSRRLGE
jgi:hypothetical protein